jgi:tagaturonate epimerase
MTLHRYSLGMGDRFGRQGRAQLAAVLEAKARGVDVAPVWNKSQREHLITGTHPDSVRAEADEAVAALGWKGPYFVDADHVTLETVDKFIGASDFFTLDVADAIGQQPPASGVSEFVRRLRRYTGKSVISGMDRALSADDIAAAARKFLTAARAAGAIYRRVEAAKGAGRFVVEVSMDEAAEPQTPGELLLLLAALAEEAVPVSTIAPKFPGRFNKGIDYVGSVEEFERQFMLHLEVLTTAVREFGLPPNLKLSVHSGSDKFALYAPIARALRRHDAGVHLKTAGTTWLEEVAGLARAGGAPLRLAQEIYAQGYGRLDELCAPYAAVIDIDRARLPRPEEVADWTAADYVAAVRHDPASSAYNPHVRQLLHVSFKVAAEMGAEYLQAIEASAAAIGTLVTENLLERHLLPVFAAPAA